MFNTTVGELEVLKFSYKAHLRIHENLGPYVSTEYVRTLLATVI